VTVVDVGLAGAEPLPLLLLLLLLLLLELPPLVVAAPVGTFVPAGFRISV
jgi:hypothetical protein